MTCGQDTELGVAAPCGSRVEANICTGCGNSHHIVAVEQSVVRSAECPCSKGDSTLWCHEAAACSDVLPCDNEKTAKANTEKGEAATSCGVFKHRHVNNTG